MPTVQDKFTLAIQEIKQHQEADDAAGISRTHRCLEYVRKALAAVGLRLPSPTAENTAYADFEVLVKDPAAYGWKQVHSPLPKRCLVYFKDCGVLPGGKVAGHIAVYDGSYTRSNDDYPFSQWWADRLVGAFVPA
jgi:hypothetical protein